MASCVLSALITDIRGKIGGIVFKRHRGGLTIMSNPRAGRRFPQTTLTQQTAIALAAAAWTAATIAQRLKWLVYANALRVSASAQQHAAYTTARHAFISYNATRQIAGQPITLTPPTKMGVAAPPLASPLFASTTSIGFGFNADPILASEFIIARVTRTFSPAASNPRTWTREIKIWTGPISAYSYWFPTRPFRSGQVVFVSQQRISTARMPSIVVRRRCAVP